MGKGRDKRRKNETPAQAQKRAARQAQKLHRNQAKSYDGADGTSAAMVGGFNNEESIETTLRRIQKTQGKVKTIEELSDVPPPSPRGNVVLVAHPERDYELILFGGEYWNGAVTEAYNDTFFYNIKRNSWGKLQCACNPAPRSSSQGVVYKHYLVIFGGEFVSQSQSQYLHFRDVWRYDARRSEWEELKALKHGPSSRSGHRMALWKRNAVVFGGFYDNALECHYYNDLWILSALDGAGSWTLVKPATTAGELPRPRSGHNLAVHNDTVFVYGGYSTAKFDRFKKSEATVHHDLWMITLSADLLSASSTLQPVWTRVKLGGVPPPIRAGVAATFKDKRMYLFGGVVDIESPGGSLVSTFHNDLFVFHMDSRRFYPVVLRKSRRGDATGASAPAGYASAAALAEETSRRAPTAGRRGNATTDNLAHELRELCVMGAAGDARETQQGGQNTHGSTKANLKKTHMNFSSSTTTTTTTTSDNNHTNSNMNCEDDEESVNSSEEEDDAESEVCAGALDAANAVRSYEVRERSGQIYPLRRMDAAMVIVNHTLYLYGGQFESAEKEITLSDLFALNLRSLESYEVLLSQDLSAAVWKGKATAASDADSWESGSTVVSAAFDMDYDDPDEYNENETERETHVTHSTHSQRQGTDDDDDDEEEEDVEDDACNALAARVRFAAARMSSSPPMKDELDDDSEAPMAIPAELDDEVTPAYVDRMCFQKGKKGLQVHKAQLLAQLGTSATVPTPHKDEAFEAFYQRTRDVWERAAVEAQSDDADEESGKRDRRRVVRRQSRAFARRRYEEARQLLSQLQLVEEREKEEARFFRERRLQKEREWQEYEEEQRRCAAAAQLTEQH